MHLRVLMVLLLYLRVWMILLLYLRVLMVLLLYLREVIPHRGVILTVGYSRMEAVQNRQETRHREQ